jgi:hypothetical protein
VSLLLHVGWLDDMRRNDPEGYRDAKKDFAAINKALRAAGATTYQEPDRLRGKGWSFKLYPENGIAFLQRFAAYFTEYDEPEEWPTPGDPKTMANPLDDEEVEEAYYMLELLPYQHLILHSPRDGYWVPVPFENVIFPDEKLGIGGQLGSSVSLLAELEELAKALRLPLEMGPEAPAVQQAKFHPGKSRTRWKKYGVESHNLLALRRACLKSVELGAAIYLY